MPSYRGVDQADLVKSINDAIALLEKYSTGPACKARIDEAKKPDASGVSPLGRIAAATTDQELVDAVSKCGLTYLFARGARVLEYHALNNTDGIGRAVWHSLRSWSAMSGAMTMEYNKYDAEFDKWLGGHRRIKGFFNRMVAKVSGTEEALYESEGALVQYGLVIEDMTSGKTDWNDPAAAVLRGQVDAILKPYYPLREVDMVGIGLISWTGNAPSPDDLQGVMFRSTRRAAEAVAAAFPGMRVVNFKREVIKPTAPKSPKKPAP